jgi:hypothetical protein
MQELETLTLQDLCQIFHVKPVSIYRWVAETRKGKSQFPAPINGVPGGKRKLIWSRNAIVAFQNANNPQPTNPESATSRKKRHTAALDSLRKRGVNVPKQSDGKTA